MKWSPEAAAPLKVAKVSSSLSLSIGYSFQISDFLKKATMKEFDAADKTIRIIRTTTSKAN